MLKTKITRLLLCCIGGCFTIASMWVYYNWQLQEPNSFLRKYPTHQLEETGVLSLSKDRWTLSGISHNSVVLNNGLRHQQLLFVQPVKRDTGSRWLHGFDTLKLSKDFQMIASGNNVFLTDGNKKIVVSGTINDGMFRKLYRSLYFTAIQPLSASSFVLRVVSHSQNTLVKFSNNHVIKSLVLEKQGDGIFSTDGMLSITSNADRLFYNFFYRNQFLCIDTNLNLLYKGRTIDTVAHAHIKVSAVKSEHQLTLSAPPLVVNEQTAANDRWLFVHSALLARNDPPGAKNNGAIIDAYDIRTGRYKQSMQLPLRQGQKLRELCAVGSYLVALTDDHLFCYLLKIQ